MSDIEYIKDALVNYDGDFLRDVYRHNIPKEVEEFCRTYMTKCGVEHCGVTHCNPNERLPFGSVIQWHYKFDILRGDKGDEKFYITVDPNMYFKDFDAFKEHIENVEENFKKLVSDVHNIPLEKCTWLSRYLDHSTMDAWVNKKGGVRPAYRVQGGDLTSKIWQDFDGRKEKLMPCNFSKQIDILEKQANKFNGN